MRTQTFSRYNPIARWGCYFLSLGKIAEDHTGILLKEEQVRQVYIEAVNHAAMKDNCYITDPAHVLNLFLSRLTGGVYRARYIGYWNADTGLKMFGKYKEADITHEVVRREYGNGYHFGLTDWNPDPRLTCGPMNGRRFFRIGIY